MKNYHNSIDYGCITISRLRRCSVLTHWSQWETHTMATGSVGSLGQGVSLRNSESHHASANIACTDNGVAQTLGVNPVGEPSPSGAACRSTHRCSMRGPRNEAAHPRITSADDGRFHFDPHCSRHGRRRRRLTNRPAPRTPIPPQFSSSGYHRHRATVVLTGTWRPRPALRRSSGLPARRPPSAR